MGDLAGIPPFGGGGVAIRPHEHAAPPAVPAVEPSLDSQGLNGQTTKNDAHDVRFAKQDRTDVDAAPVPALQRDPIDRHALAGPTPAFQVSLLEMDRQLQDALARMEAAHSQPESEAAIAVSEAPSDTPAPEAQTRDAPEAARAAIADAPPEAPLSPGTPDLSQATTQVASGAAPSVPESGPEALVPGERA